MVVTLSMRQQVRQNVAANLESTQRMFADARIAPAARTAGPRGDLAENPTLKAAIDTFAAESQAADEEARAQLARDRHARAGQTRGRTWTPTRSSWWTSGCIRWPPLVRWRVSGRAGSRSRLHGQADGAGCPRGHLRASGAAYRAVVGESRTRRRRDRHALRRDAASMTTMRRISVAVSNAQIAMVTDGRIVAARYRPRRRGRSICWWASTRAAARARRS